MTKEQSLIEHIENLEEELTNLRFGMLHILTHINDTLDDIGRWQRWQGSQAEIDYLIEFRDEIALTFSLSEFRDMCLALNVDFDALGGEGLNDKTRELILYFKRRGLLKELKNHVKLERPYGSWPDVA